MSAAQQAAEAAGHPLGARLNVRLAPLLLIAMQGRCLPRFSSTPPESGAHPAFLMVTPSATSNQSVLSGGYAGSPEEFETLFEQLLTHLRETKKAAIGDDVAPVGIQER